MLLEAKNLSMWFGSSRKRPACKLFGMINLKVARGEVKGLFGPSGVGKSTLGNILLGLITPREGSVLWQGRDIKSLSVKKRIALRPRFQKLFQDPAASFYPGQSLMQSMLEVLRYQRPSLTPQKAVSIINSALPPLGLEPDLLERFPEEVSGGEIQRLALARIGLVEPFFLVADEPTSRLDLSVQAQVARLLAAWARAHNMGLLLISHDRALLEHLCDSILLLDAPGPGRSARLRPL